MARRLLLDMVKNSFEARRRNAVAVLALAPGIDPCDLSLGNEDLDAAVSSNFWVLRLRHAVEIDWCGSLARRLG